MANSFEPSTKLVWHMLVGLARWVVWLVIALLHVVLAFTVILLMWIFQVTPHDVSAWLHAMSESTLGILFSVLGVSVLLLAGAWIAAIRAIHRRYGRNKIWRSLRPGYEGDE